MYSTLFITPFHKARVFNISKKKVSLQSLLSLSSNSKYHRSPPQSKFKSGKCISVVCIFLPRSRRDDGCHSQCSLSSVTFDFPLGDYFYF